MTDGQDPASGPRSVDLVAPVWHSVVLLAVLAALTLLGWLAQQRVQTHTQSPAPPSRLVPLQIEAIIFEWATLVWVWFGVRRKGVRLRALVAGRWPDVKSVLVDILLGGGLWVLWIGISRVENFLLGPNHSTGAIPYPCQYARRLSSDRCRDLGRSLRRDRFSRLFTKAVSCANRKRTDSGSLAGGSFWCASCVSRNEVSRNGVSLRNTLRCACPLAS